MMVINFSSGLTVLALTSFEQWIALFVPVDCREIPINALSFPGGLHNAWKHCHLATTLDVLNLYLHFSRPFF